MFYNQTEFEELLKQNVPLGINITVIDHLLQDFPDSIEAELSAQAEKLLKKWKSILVFELLSPFWFLDRNFDLEQKHQIAAAAVKTSMAIKILDDHQDIYSKAKHYPLLEKLCFAWWALCQKHKLNHGDFRAVFENWRTFSKDAALTSKSRAEILASKIPFYDFISQNYLRRNWEPIKAYTSCVVLLDDLMDVIEDYKLGLPNSIISPIISSRSLSPHQNLQNFVVEVLLQDKIIEENLEQLNKDFKSLIDSSAAFPCFQNHVKHIAAKIAEAGFQKYLYYKIFVLD